jgi:crotonobetainyl-CoA:carnitine CoA-transferase CaiB-like acyl-CoA transferase
VAVGVAGVLDRRLVSGRPAESVADLVVADLSALWAGPLVGALLVRVGAQVMKVESVSRPDGARRGSPAHFASLNGGKEEVAVDLTRPDGLRALHRIVDGADVVITSARPRALAQLGLDPESLVRHGRPRVWLSITGYGAGPGSADRVAFGDDAAAAGGLVVRDGRGPCFCADAVADPVTGLAATAAVLDALVRGGDHILDASMSEVAGSLVGGAEPTDSSGPG